MPDIHDLPRRVPLPLSAYDRISQKPKRPKRPKKPWRTPKLLSVGFILLMLGVIAFSVYQVARHITVGLNTLRTQEILDESYVRLELYVFRNEKVLVAPESDVCLYTVGNGERVGVGESLGTAYAVEDPATAPDLQQKLNAYGARIELTKTLGGTGTPSDARDAAAAVDREYLRLLDAAERGDLSAVYGYAAGMQDGIGRYDILTGAAGSTSVADLEQQRAALVSGLSKVVDMTTKQSGYFYYDCDGYESLFSADMAMTMTADDFFALTKRSAAPLPAGAVGKMVYDPTWYAAAYVSLSDEALELFQQGYRSGTTYKMRVTDRATSELDMTIVRMVPDAGGALLVFRSQDMPADFEFPRCFTAETVSRQMSGYRIPSEAIVTVHSHKTGEDVQGVYVLAGNVVEFRKISIRIARDGYVIAQTHSDVEAYRDTLTPEERSRFDADGWSYLGLNDNIITGGNEIYEGKVIG